MADRRQPHSIAINTKASIIIVARKYRETPSLIEADTDPFAGESTQRNGPGPDAPDSVGIITPHAVVFEEPLSLKCGRKLPTFELIYETYGTLNAQKSNAILICHALSGTHHAAGFHCHEDTKPGWWDNFIGPGKPIDTNLFYVVSLNNLGGCHGSSGPTQINPETGKPWGPNFPIVTVADWVDAQARLADYLGINCFAAIIGGSMGGMQALQWSITYPNRLQHAIVIASAAKLSAQNIAFNEIARQAILSDPDFHQGHYYEHGCHPKRGLILARMLGHVTYLSDHAMRLKFGRELKSGALNFDYSAEFQVESYLRYQGEAFSERFDANTYLLMTKALDYFDPAAEHGNDLGKALAPATCAFLVLSFSSDWRFAPDRSREITNALMSTGKRVSHLEIEAPQGHDAFLLKVPRYVSVMQTYLRRVADAL
jgi:homoserine O-acetyltransferase